MAGSATMSFHAACEAPTSQPLDAEQVTVPAGEAVPAWRAERATGDNSRHSVRNRDLGFYSFAAAVVAVVFDAPTPAVAAGLNAHVAAAAVAAAAAAGVAFATACAAWRLACCACAHDWAAGLSEP